jgi:hypothetical protein
MTTYFEKLISFNEAIIYAKKIIRKDKAYMGGYNGVNIDGVFYVSTFQFKSNRSKCYNRLVNYLQENQIPHGVEKVHLRWGEVESKEIHVSIFKYKIVLMCECGDEECDGTDCDYPNKSIDFLYHKYVRIHVEHNIEEKEEVREPPNATQPPNA